MSDDDRPIANARDLAPRTLSHGPHTLRRGRLGRAAGSTDLGCSLVEVPPGRCAADYCKGEPDDDG